MSGVFLDDFEEPFGVHHDEGIWGVKANVPVIFITLRGWWTSTEKAENGREAVT